MDIKELKFDSNGLIPAIVVDEVTKNVLTLAYMNEESLKITLEKGLTCFYSRGRQQLWLKGETSGNYPFFSIRHAISKIGTKTDMNSMYIRLSISLLLSSRQASSKRRGSQRQRCIPRSGCNKDNPRR